MTKTIWVVERGEYDQTFIAAAFATEATANEYVADRGDGYVTAVELHSQVEPQATYWGVGAEVYPDGTVNRWEKEYKADNTDFCGSVDQAERLHEPPWDGHTQGHCGFHVSVHGADHELTRRTRDAWVKKYLPHCDGRCRGCGRTENYVRSFFPGPQREVPVRLVGGPFDSEVIPTLFYEDAYDVNGPIQEPTDGLIRLHGTIPDALTDTYYGPIEREGDEWIRHHVHTRPVEKKT